MYIALILIHSRLYKIADFLSSKRFNLVSTIVLDKYITSGTIIKAPVY